MQKNEKHGNFIHFDGKNNIACDILLNILKVVEKSLDISHICYIFAMKTIYAITIYNLILRYGYNL